MLIKILIWMIILIVLIVVIYMTSNIIDKMKILNGDLVREWNDLKEYMDVHFRLIIKEVDSENQELINIINRQSKIVKNEDFVNAYYDLEKVIPNCNFSDELREELKSNSDRIEALRKEYDDDALAMNNYVNSFPTNFIAIFLGYKKWIYFRGK